MEIYTKRQLYRKHPKAIECLMKKLGIEYCPPWDKSKRAPCVEQILKWQEKHVAHKDAFGKGHNLSNVATENQELGQAGMGQTRPFLQHAANSIKTSVYSVRKSTSSESESTTEEVEDTAAVVWKPFQRHEPCADDKEVPTKDDEKRCVDAKSQCTEPAVSCRESIADPGDELIDFDPEALHPRRNATDRNLLANLGIYELAPTRLNPSRHHPKSAEESQDAVNVASDQSGNRASVKLGNAITRNILAAPGKAYPAGLHLEPGVSTSVNPLDFFKTFCPATLKSGSDTISPYEPKIELSDGSQLSPFIAHLLLTSQLPLPETIQRSEHKALLNELVDKAKTNTTLSVTSHSVGATGKGNKYSAAQKYRTMEERIAKLEADIKERNDEIKEQKVVNGNFHRRLIEVREDNEDLYKQMSKLKSSTESHSKRLDALGTMAHTGRHLRNRFFETFKRDVLKVSDPRKLLPVIELTRDVSTGSVQTANYPPRRHSGPWGSLPGGCPVV